MAVTTNLALPLIDGSMTADVPRDMNALANVLDTAIPAEIAELAGAGRTAETVKGNADALIAHKDDTVQDVGGVHGLTIESGTWTPSLAGITTQGSNTYSAQIGTYYKTGKMVVVQFDLTLSAKDAAMAGALLITGLPFAPSATKFAPVFSQIENVTLSAGYAQHSGFIFGSSSIALTQMGGTSGTWTNIASGAATNTTAFRGSITYFTS
jgi:hypothetical protein